MDNIISIKNLKKYFPMGSKLLPGKKRWNKAVDDVSLEIKKSEVVGIVGESGSGKTTLAKMILGLHKPTGGTIDFYCNENNANNSKNNKNKINLSVVFQDPFSSLDPRMTVFDIVEESLVANRISKQNINYRQTILKTLNSVGLSDEQMFRYPHEFSGGQRQRIAIARAIISNPFFIVFDEPTSGLDVSVQAQILNLLKELREQLNTSYLFISHNIGVIKYISTRIVIMYLGKIVEIANTDELFSNPLHPYTKRLLAAVPEIRTSKLGKKIEGIIVREDSSSNTGDLSNEAEACVYYAYCPIREDICLKKTPDRIVVGKDHEVYCSIIDRNKN
jgi:oligopeptide/dipeptide ABC transporter ATP-binding protein